MVDYTDVINEINDYCSRLILSRKPGYVPQVHQLNGEIWLLVGLQVVSMVSPAAIR